MTLLAPAIPQGRRPQPLALFVCEVERKSREYREPLPADRLFHVFFYISPPIAEQDSPAGHRRGELKKIFCERRVFLESPRRKQEIRRNAGK